MTTNIGVGTTNRSHWSNRAQALLAPLLHAAAVHDQDMETVVGTVLGHDLEPAGILLEDGRCSRLAFNTLLGLHNTEDRERSSIFSAAADALQAYTSETALRAARDPNFDPATFVRSHDTIYIHAPAEEQAAVAPIVCGLLAEIRRQTYRAHSTGQLAGGGMLFALDEVANIARWRSCRRSPPKAAAKASFSSPRSRTSPRPDNAGAPKPMGSSPFSGPS
jgi:type IV secretion system protein VirD4